MKRSLLKKGLAATAALATAAGLLSVTSPAQAAPPPGTVIIATAGSDTTDDLMNQLLTNPDPNGPGDNGRYNIRAVYSTGNALFVPSDANCNTDNRPASSGNYVQPPNTGIVYGNVPGATVNPNGSTAGRNALRDSVNNPDAAKKGCIDNARSSSGPRSVSPTGDNATFEYYALGLDVLGIASPSLNAPLELTPLEVYDIFFCNIRDWATVGGAPGPIQRINVQAGSGTGDFFRGTFLGNTAVGTVPSGVAADPSKGGPGNPTGTCPDAPALQENDATGITAAQYQNAIQPYSAGQWIFQGNNSLNPTVDKRRGSRILNLTAVSDGNPTTRNASEPISLGTTSGSTTITSPDPDGGGPLAAPERFTNVNQGATVTGTGIPAGATIVSVTNPTTAVISAAATATGTATDARITSIPIVPVTWFTAGLGSWLPGTPSGTNPRGPVTEDQVALNNAAADYTGVRLVFNVLDSNSPNYLDARAIVGFNNVPAGAKSPLCNNANATTIRSSGFAPLPTTAPATVDPNANLAGSNCRRYNP